MPDGYDVSPFDVAAFDAAITHCMSTFDAVATGIVSTLTTVYADDAIYTPVLTSTPADICIVLAWQDDVSTFSGLDVQVRAPGLRGEVKQTYLAAAPEIGDTVQVLTGPHVGTYAVKDFFADVERTQWTLDLAN